MPAPGVIANCPRDVLQNLPPELVSPQRLRRTHKAHRPQMRKKRVNRVCPRPPGRLTVPPTRTTPLVTFPGSASSVPTAEILEPPRHRSSATMIGFTAGSDGVVWCV